MPRQRLFVASCVSLVTTSMVFAIRGDVAGPMSSAFKLTNEQMGLIFSPAFWAFTIAIFISGGLVDIVGMRALHILSAIGYFVGIGLVLLAPHPAAPVASIFDNSGTALLYAGFLVMGLSQGLVEGVINPLVATIYSDQKTKRLNMLHAWWPGGLVIGGLLAVAMTMAINASWQLKLATILVPAAIYLIMAMTMPYPATERVASNISTTAMWGEAAKPLFLLLFVCMWMTAAAELGPDQWFPTVMGALVPKLQGVLFLVYTAGLMFLLRTFGSGIAHKNPIGTLFVCSILTGLGLYWLGSLQPGTGAFVAFAAATLFGIGKSYFWPTMIGVTAEQFPRGGALLISLMGGAGMLSVAVALPIMGSRIDSLGPAAALRMVAVLGAILAVIFGGLLLYFRRRGGYKAIQLSLTRT
ncbi:MAG TPA: MFS transporter [Vicinamibacterales bacterium]|nr:MFS transporter [Vicinamibacterales bacterium]